MLEVVAAMPFKSELMFEKKSLPVPAMSPPEVWTRLMDSLRLSLPPPPPDDWLPIESLLSKPFLLTTSLALFVRSPMVCFPT